MSHYRYPSMEQELPEQRYARSIYMSREEIEEERSRSEWNPYRGEEEADVSPEAEPEISKNAENVLPYFQKNDYQEAQRLERRREQDMRNLQSLYPEGAQIILPYVQEECDRMEYEGSRMYDEYLDRTMLYQMEERIYPQVVHQFSGVPEPEAPEDFLTVELQGKSRRSPGKNWLGDLIDILLIQEISCRRQRRRNLCTSIPRCRWKF